MTRRLLLATGLLLASACDASRLGPPRVGEPAPAYGASTLEGGREVSLADLRGRPVLLNVWATWCHPCRREMPELQRLHQERGPDGLQVVGVSIDERGRDDAIRGFLRDFGVTYPIWLDPDARVSSTFALMGVPGTFLIGGDGTLLWSRMGPVAADDPGLVEALETALKGS